MTVFSIVLGAVLGAVLGSFATCAQWRLPRRISMGGRSVCPSCGQVLAARHNVPVFGWLALRGRAACCGQRIGARYVLIELGCLAAGALAGWLLGWLACFAIVIGVLIVIALISALTAEQPPPSESADATVK